MPDFLVFDFWVIESGVSLDVIVFHKMALKTLHNGHASLSPSKHLRSVSPAVDLKSLKSLASSFSRVILYHISHLV